MEIHKIHALAKGNSAAIEKGYEAARAIFANPEWTDWSFFASYGRYEAAKGLKYEDTSNGTVFSMMFANPPVNRNFVVPELDTHKGTDFSGMFYKCQALQEVPTLHTSAGEDFYQMFFGCNNLQTIKQIDLTSATNVQQMFQGCNLLKTIKFEGTISISGISLGGATKLYAASIMSAIQALENNAESGTTKTIQFGSANLAKLPDEMKAIATEKGWTLT